MRYLITLLLLLSITVSAGSLSDFEKASRKGKDKEKEKEKTESNSDCLSNGCNGIGVCFNILSAISEDDDEDRHHKRHHHHDKDDDDENNSYVNESSQRSNSTCCLITQDMSGRGNTPKVDATTRPFHNIFTLQSTINPYLDKQSIEGGAEFVFKESLAISLSVENLYESELPRTSLLFLTPSIGYAFLSNHDVELIAYIGLVAISGRYHTNFFDTFIRFRPQFQYAKPKADLGLSVSDKDNIMLHANFVMGVKLSRYEPFIGYDVKTINSETIDGLNFGINVHFGLE